MTNERDDLLVEGSTVQAQHATLIEAQEPTPELRLAPSPNGDGQVAVVREGYRLERLAGPRRVVRRHVFEDLRTFAAFVAHVAYPATTDILVDHSEIRARFFPASPTSDEITCRLLRHPTFAAWMDAIGRPLSQRDLLRLVRGQAKSLGEQAETLLAKLQQVSVVTSGDFRSEIDATGSPRLFGSTDKTTINVSLPPKFLVVTPIIAGVEAVGSADERSELTYVLEVFVNMDPGAGKGVVFTLDCPGLELPLHAARRDAVAFLESLLDKDFLVGIGALKTVEVAALTREAL
jgi:hypothetical protein